MAKLTETAAEPRITLTRERVLKAAVALADNDGIESLSMRRLAHELGVEAMSLYNHVDNKEGILDGMVDVVVNEIVEPSRESDWKTAMRQKAMSARQALLRHPWAPDLIASRNEATPTVMKYMDSVIGILLRGGFSNDLAHHSLHALGSRALGFTQELFEADDPSPEMSAALMLQLQSGGYPNIAQMLTAVDHDEDSVVGGGCDDQFEFEFALDLILHGLEKLRDRESKAG